MKYNVKENADFVNSKHALSIGGDVVMPVAGASAETPTSGD